MKLPESTQRTMTFAEDMTVDQQTNRSTLTVQQTAQVIPEHERKSYPSDLTDAQWQRIVPLLPPAEPKGRQNGVELREVINGILYVAGDSYDWRSFPHDLPPMNTLYYYFRQWRLDGTWQEILDALHPEVIPYKVDYRFVMSWQKILDALPPEEYEVNGHEELPGATPGNTVSGEPLSGGLLSENDDICNIAPLIDARGNQAVSQAIVSTTPEVSVVVPTRNEQENIWPLDEQFEVMRYAEWLTAEAKRNNNGSHQEESKKYAEDALRTVTVKGKEFRPFAPFRPTLSAYKTLTRGQAVILSTICLGVGSAYCSMV